VDRRFQGESLNKVDGKGRVSIPVKFRRVLQNCDGEYQPGGAARLYVAYGDPNKNYLECLTGDAYDQIDKLIQSLQMGSKLRRALSKLYYAKCDEIHLDDTGRMVLPQAARDKIGLTEEALFEGNGEKFHIMNPAQGDVEDDSIHALLAELGQGDAYFDPLSLAVPTASADEA
jgi:MraZ protein